MAEDTFKEDKTETGTAKKREKAREQGSALMSQEVNTVVVLLFSALILSVVGSYMLDHFLLTYKISFRLLSTFRISPDNLIEILTMYIYLFLKTTAPFLVLIMIFGVGASYCQVGWMVAWKSMEPKWDKLKPKFKELNPFKGEKLVKLLISVAKLCVIGPIIYYTIEAEIDNFIPFVDQHIYFFWVFIMKLAFKVVIRISIILIFLAAADYAQQWWKFEENLKMTKDEVKQEKKDQEGDPAIKSWQRTQRFKMFQKFMLSKVPEADVVITNPTTYAVAVKYDDLSMNAPKVIAKGMRKMAEKIKDIAKKHNIPIVENKPLAQALYKEVEVSQEVPASFYKAVAEVLAYVYNLKNKKIHV
ncbi:MAG: EscU/YscU/HrcU family type III secretion system export apparatus switch protein [Candidatus Aureabacteria bacterium]|nr:EscU/YscU/HrcU family type III secretion system export apparatus switch protein [Candidatus Auribacterota bacterium]